MHCLSECPALPIILSPITTILWRVFKSSTSVWYSSLDGYRWCSRSRRGRSVHAVPFQVLSVIHCWRRMPTHSPMKTVDHIASLWTLGGVAKLDTAVASSVRHSSGTVIYKVAVALQIDYSSSRTCPVPCCIGDVVHRRWRRRWRQTGSMVGLEKRRLMMMRMMERILRIVNANAFDFSIVHRRRYLVIWQTISRIPSIVLTSVLVW